MTEDDQKLVQQNLFLSKLITLSQYLKLVKERNTVEAIKILKMVSCSDDWFENDI